ncbi:MAG: phosphatase PAP2 family protein [Vicinamibacterales bacterium]
MRRFPLPMYRRLAAALAVTLSIWVVPATGTAQEVSAQATAPAPPAAQAPAAPAPEQGFFKSLFVNLGDDVKHIPRKNSLYWVAAGAGLALAVHPIDEDLNAHLSGSFSDKFFKPGKVIGSFPFILGTSVITYVVGRAGDHPRARHLGGDLIEAALLSEGITEGIKAIVRRDRPLRDDGTRAKGFSFPSGHSAVTFAAATVLQQHLGWKAAIPTYAAASYVAISRLHDNRHFASDIAAGAAEGIIIGRSVTWHGRNFYGTPILGAGTAGVMFSVQ